MKASFVCRARNVFHKVQHGRLFSCSGRHDSRSLIGFVGLGNMGSPMAHNLLSKGHAIIAYDVFPESMAAVQEAGAQLGQNPADIAQKADRIITMLPDNKTVLEVYLGGNGIFQSVNPGTLLIDSSTVDPAISRQVASKIEEKGAVFLDAPVSGGINAAKAGSLTFMVGGNKQEFEAAQKLLYAMGKNVIHCGGVGCGQASKICNNMLLAISMIGTAEAMNLGIRLGLDPKTLAKIMNASTGRCWSSAEYNPVPGVMENVPASNNYEGGFGTKLMTKDLGIAQDSATRSASSIPLGSLAHQIYRLMVTKGFASKDFSSVFQFIREDTNRDPE